MAQFEITVALRLETPTNDLKVSVTHSVEDGKFLDVTFSSPSRDQMVTVPAEVWEMVIAAVADKKEF